MEGVGLVRGFQGRWVRVFLQAYPNEPGKRVLVGEMMRFWRRVDMAFFFLSLFFFPFWFFFFLTWDWVWRGLDFD